MVKFATYEHEDDIIGILCSQPDSEGYDLEYDRAERAVAKWMEQHYTAQADPSAAAPSAGFDADPREIAHHIFEEPAYWQR
jgi:hypothetical protein